MNAVYFLTQLDNLIATAPYTTKRNFHSSIPANNNQHNRPPSNDKSSSSSSGNNDNNDDDRDKDKVPSMLAKAFLWMITAYMFIAVVSLLFPSSNQPEVNTTKTFYSFVLSIGKYFVIFFCRLFDMSHTMNSFITCWRRYAFYWMSNAILLLSGMWNP